MIQINITSGISTAISTSQLALIIVLSKKLPNTFTSDGGAKENLPFILDASISSVGKGMLKPAGVTSLDESWRNEKKKNDGSK